MSNLISREELDALLKAFPEEESERPSRGGEAARTASTDSAHVCRPLETWRDRLDEVFDVFITEATRQLSNLLRTSTNLSPATTRYMSYDEFTSQFPTPTTLAVVGTSLLRERFIVEIEPSLAFPVVDRLLGGRGLPYRTLRDLTQLEKRILARFVRAILQALSAAANLPVELTPEIENLQDATAFIPCFDSHEPVTSASFMVEIGGSAGAMRLCLPQVITELLCDPAATAASVRSASGPARGEHLVINVIGDLKVPVAAYLSKGTVTLNELISMKQRDVVLLDRKIREGLIVTVHVGRRPKFSASLGTVAGKRAARIVEPLKREPGQRRTIFDRGEAARGEVPYRDGDSAITMTEIPQFRAIDDTAFQHVDVGSPSVNRRRRRTHPDHKNNLPAASVARESARQAADAELATNLDRMRDIELDIAANLGSAELPLKEVLDLDLGSIVTFDRVTADPVDLVAGGRVVAQGEIVIVGEDYGVRITRAFNR